MHFYINTISGVIVGAEVVVIGVPTGVGVKEGGEAVSGKWQKSCHQMLMSLKVKIGDRIFL